MGKYNQHILYEKKLILNIRKKSGSISKVDLLRKM